MSDKNKILKFLIQVIGWGLVFGFPLFFTWKEGNPMTWVKFLGYVGVPIAFITVFYAIILFLSIACCSGKGYWYLLLSIYSFLCC